MADRSAFEKLKIGLAVQGIGVAAVEEKHGLLKISAV